jgi:Sec-independent protein translocase protein TatA
MWRQRLCVTLGVVTVLTGCAANRIGAPAKTIGGSVATFQEYLSKFQDTLTEEQAYQRLSIAGSTASRDLDLAWTKQLQAEWTIASAKRGTDMFSLLQSQGKDEVTPLLAPATSATPPASISLPVDKLVIVATTMKQISKGQSTKASFEDLVNSIQNQAKTKAEQPAAPKK